MKAPNYCECKSLYDRGTINGDYGGVSSPLANTAPRTAFCSGDAAVLAEEMHSCPSEWQCIFFLLCISF